MENKIYDASDVAVKVAAPITITGPDVAELTLNQQIYKLFQYNHEIQVKQAGKDGIHISMADMEQMYKDAEAMQSILTKHWDVFVRAAEAFADTLLDKVEYRTLFTEFFGKKLTEELCEEIGQSFIGALGAYEQTLEPPDIIYHLSRYVAGIVGREL